MSEQIAGVRALHQSAGNKKQMTYTEFLDSSPMTKFLWLLLFGLCLAQLLDGIDFQATSFAMPGIIKEFRLNPAQAGVIPAITNLGLAIGAVFFPLLCDRVGRKPIFQWILLTYAFGTFICAISPTYQILLTGRFIAGIGIGAQFPIVMAILAEYSPARLRHIFVPIGPIFYSVGWIVVALLALWLIPLYGWRTIYWIGIAPAAMTLFVRFLLPESVRYLLARGKVEEAGQIVNDIARKTGRADIQLVPPVMRQAPAKQGLGQQIGSLGPVFGTMVILSIFYFCHYMQMFGVSVWLPTLFVRYGFVIAKSFTYTMIIFIAVPISQVIAIWFQNKVSRKWALFIMTWGGTVFFILFGTSFQQHWPVWAMVGSQVCQVLLYNGVIVVLYTISAELFPTSVRTLGMGIVNGVGRIGAMLGPFILGVFLKENLSIGHILYLFALPPILGSACVVVAIKIDSRRKSLEEISMEVAAQK